jgi:hypothetical protein
MDIKAKVEEIVAKVKDDPKMQERFKSEPTKVVEEVAGVDLPEDQIDSVISAVKAKINVDGITSKLGGLFGKKSD